MFFIWESVIWTRVFINCDTIQIRKIFNIKIIVSIVSLLNHLNRYESTSLNLF